MRAQAWWFAALAGVAVVAATAALGPFVGLVALGAALVAQAFLLRKPPLPWREIAEVIRALARGELARRLYLGADSEEGLVNQALDQLALYLGQLRADRERLLALLDQLDDAILLLDHLHHVTLGNQAAARLAGKGRELTGMHLLSVVGRSDLVRLAEAARAGRAQGEVSFAFDGRFFVARASKLSATGEVLLLLSDRTEEQRVNQMRSDFVANVSHELRTPLALVAGYAETLASPGLTLEEARRFGAVVHAEAQRLRRLVEDLLALSRAEAGGRLPLEPMRVAPGLARVLGRFLDQAAAKEVRVRLTGDLAARALGQGERVDQIVSNLLDNAVRHSPPRGTITLRLATGEEQVTLAVADEGEGIPEAELARIFERFYRVDKSRRRADGGAGLGLAIARHLAEGMSGRLEVQSRLGQGATFTLTLKAAQASASYRGAEED